MKYHNLNFAFSQNFASSRPFGLWFYCAFRGNSMGLAFQVELRQSDIDWAEFGSWSWESAVKTNKIVVVSLPTINLLWSTLWRENEWDVKMIVFDTKPIYEASAFRICFSKSQLVNKQQFKRLSSMCIIQGGRGCGELVFQGVLRWSFETFRRAKVSSMFNWGRVIRRIRKTFSRNIE